MDNLARAMKGVPKDIVMRQVGHFSKADRAYGEGVAKRLGV
jgi:catalase